MKSILKIAIPSVCFSILALGAPEKQFAYANKTPLHQMSVEHEPSTQMMQPNQEQERSVNYHPVLKDQRKQAKNSNLAKTDQDENPRQASNGRTEGGAQAKQDNRKQIFGKTSELKRGDEDDTKKVGNMREKQDEKKQQEKGQESAQRGKEEQIANKKIETNGQTAKVKNEEANKMTKGKSKSEDQDDKKSDGKKTNNFITAALRPDETATKKADDKKRTAKEDEHFAANKSAPQSHSSANNSANSSLASAETPRQSKENTMQQDGNKTNMAPKANNASENATQNMDANKPALDAPIVDNSSVNSTKSNKSTNVQVSVSTSTNVSTTSKVSVDTDKTRLLADEKLAFNNEKPAREKEASSDSASEKENGKGKQSEVSQKQERKQDNDMKMEKSQAQSRAGQKNEERSNAKSEREDKRDRKTTQEKKKEEELSNVQAQNAQKGQEKGAKVNIRGVKLDNNEVIKRDSSKGKENDRASSPINEKKGMKNTKTTSKRNQLGERRQERSSPRK